MFFTNNCVFRIVKNIMFFITKFKIELNDNKINSLKIKNVMKFVYFVICRYNVFT